MGSCKRLYSVISSTSIRHNISDLRCMTFRYNGLDRMDITILHRVSQMVPQHLNDSTFEVTTSRKLLDRRSDT